MTSLLEKGLPEGWSMPNKTALTPDERGVLLEWIERAKERVSLTDNSAPYEDMDGNSVFDLIERLIEEREVRSSEAVYYRNEIKRLNKAFTAQEERFRITLDVLREHDRRPAKSGGIT